MQRTNEDTCNRIEQAVKYFYAYCRQKAPMAWGTPDAIAWEALDKAANKYIVSAIHLKKVLGQGFNHLNGKMKHYLIDSMQ